MQGGPPAPRNPRRCPRGALRRRAGRARATGGRTVDARIERLRDAIEDAKQQAQILTSDVSAASERIEAVAGQALVAGGKLRELEAELAEHRRRLAQLRAEYALETRRLRTLERAERVAQRRLERRLVDIYINEPPDELEIIFQVRSLNDLISRSTTSTRSHGETGRSRTRWRARRRGSPIFGTGCAETKAAETRTTALLATRTAEQRRTYDQLVSYRSELVGAQADRRALLARIQDDRHEAEEDLTGLEQASAELAARLQRRTLAHRAAAGGVGERLHLARERPDHEPLRAALGAAACRNRHRRRASARRSAPPPRGRSIYAGWLGGYGNLVVVDHGGGLATAYAHQQRMYVSVGETIAQGQVLGEVGSTGNSTGPHLHFEVRVNGTAVDPLGYL